MLSLRKSEAALRVMSSSLIQTSLQSSEMLRGYSVTLTGHSLGGQAVQYIAEHPPQACLTDRTAANGTFSAYAFASTRNPAESSSQVSRRQDNDHSSFDYRANVKSYLILGDQVLKRLNLGREQIGSVTTFKPGRGSSFGLRYGTRHSIDSIQNSICDCLNGQGEISMRKKCGD